MKTPFVWLGSGRAKKWNVGDKARLLDQAAKAGLPVPAGGILLDEFFQLVLAEGVVVAEDGRFSAPDPDWLAETLFDGIHFPRLDKPTAVYAVSSSASPCLDIDLNDPAQLADALCSLWSQPAPTDRRDLLIMEMVTVSERGSARNEPTEAQDIIQVDAAPPSSPLYLPHLRGWQRPNPSLPPYAQRLQRLLRGVRRTFGLAKWEITWADDGRICWLLQITLHPDS
jgi:pyruvate,water dikinase